MVIIPAIDIIGGKCVRLTKGDYEQKKVYADDPVEVAKGFEQAGLKRLHVVDLDGAKSSRIVNHEVLTAITNQTSLQVDFGGGIKTDSDIELAFACGAQQVTVGSIAVKDSTTCLRWLKKYSSERIILGADVMGEYIAVHGWQETSTLALFPFLERYLGEGVKYVICTDIAKDGMLQGSSIELYKRILEKFPSIQLIASGGVDGMTDLRSLQGAGLYGAIVGKAIYEGRVTAEELAKL